MPTKRKNRKSSKPKTGIWITETVPGTNRKRTREVKGGLIIGRDRDGRPVQIELPPQPIRVLPPRTEEDQPKTPKRKAG